jgi:hypothetical protein
MEFAKISLSLIILVLGFWYLVFSLKKIVEVDSKDYFQKRKAIKHFTYAISIILIDTTFIINWVNNL